MMKILCFVLVQLVGCGSNGTYQKKEKEKVGVKETEMLVIVHL